SVVPADKLGGGMAALQLFTRDAKRAIRARPVGENDDLIGAGQLLEGKGSADLHISPERKTRRAGDLVIGERDLFDLRVIRCNSAAPQAVRCGKPIEHVDARAWTLPQQGLGGIETARARTDYGNVKIGCIFGGHECQQQVKRTSLLNSRAGCGGLPRSEAGSV